MIWPFRPRCPLDVHNKVWTERWLARLAAEFGVDRLLIGHDVFDTAGRIFAERDLFEGDAKAILSAICERMRFDPDRFSLQPEPPEEGEAPVTHGRWEVDDDGRYVVEVKDIDAGGLELQITMLARLVGCALLNERGSFNPDELNDWWRAELTAVAMGFGPMIGNMTLAVVPSALGEAYGVPKKLLRYGYLPSYVTGYALAVLCWLGGDNEPGHGSMLRRDAADSYRHGLRYLHRTGDCLVQPEIWGHSIEIGMSRCCSRICPVGLRVTGWQQSGTCWPVRSLRPVLSMPSPRDFRTAIPPFVWPRPPRSASGEWMRKMQCPNCGTRSDRKGTTRSACRPCGLSESSVRQRASRGRSAAQCWTSFWT